MDFGNFAGGFAKGMTNAIQLDQGQQKINLLKQQAQNEQKQKILDGINTNVGNATKQIKLIHDGVSQKIMAVQNSGLPPDQISAQVSQLQMQEKQAISHIVDPIEQTLNAAATQGYPVKPGTLQSMADNIINLSPSAQEQTTNKASSAGATKKAEQQAIADVNGTSYKPVGAFSPSLNKQFTAYDNGKGGLLMLENGQFKPVPDDTYPVGTQVQGSKTEALGQKTTSSLQDQIIKGKDQVAQLDQVVKNFDPSFLTLPKQAYLAGLKGAARLGIQLSPENEADVKKYATFAQDSIALVNQTIHDLTGAQMNQYEAGRIRKQVPDPENDDPVTFKAKLENALKLSKLAIARHNFFLKNGVDFNFSSDKNPPISLEQMGSMIEQSIKSEISTLKENNPNMDDETAKRLAIQRAKQDYGL